jgi:hypothetical protein
MRYPKLPSRLFLAALLSGGAALTIPVVASAAPATLLQSVHVSRDQSVLNAGYHWRHRRWHHRRRGGHYG